jgi:ABC-type multidrug transport system fused ATPase/permease subunit
MVLLSPTSSGPSTSIVRQLRALLVTSLFIFFARRICVSFFVVLCLLIALLQLVARQERAKGRVGAAAAKTCTQASPQSDSQISRSTTQNVLCVKDATKSLAQEKSEQEKSKRERNTFLFTNKRKGMWSITASTITLLALQKRRFVISASSSLKRVKKTKRTIAEVFNFCVVQDHVMLGANHYHNSCCTCSTCGKQADANMVVLDGKVTL